MCDSLETARSKITVMYLAQHLELAEAKSFLKSLRETVMFLERRVSRETILLNKTGRSVTMPPTPTVM